MVVRNWQLPPVMVWAYRWHHTTNLVVLPEVEGTLMVLFKLALHLCNLRNGDDAVWASWRPLVLGCLVKGEATLIELGRELAALP